jgi:glycosyltransferase involved in cell wall biosynthesis
MTGKPYVVSPHGMLEPWIRARSPGLKRAVSALYQNSFLRRASGFHLLTDKEGADVAEFLRGQPATVIPNFAEPFSGDRTPPRWWKKDYENRRVYLFLGRLHEKKGVMELLEAWERLSNEDPDFRGNSVLAFCGWNDGIDGFEKRVEQLGSAFGNVVFAGPQYGVDKARSLGVANFFLLPSKSEGLPMAILEGWAAGVPAIMSPECNLATGFERGAAFPTGFTADTIYPALRAARNLSHDAWLEASGKARDLVAERYSEESVREGLVSLYHQAGKWRAGQ